MNQYLQELCGWLNSDQWGRKCLFVRNRSAGYQVLRMAAAHGAPAVNAVPMSIREYMYQLADPVLASRGLQRIDTLTAAVALQGIMRQSGEAFTTMGEVEMNTAASVLPQLDELERNGLSPEQLAGSGESLLSSVWKSYMEWRRQNGYAGEKQLLEAARIPEDTSFAVFSNVQADQTERAFLAGIPRERLRVIHVHRPGDGDFLRNVLPEDGSGNPDTPGNLFENVACFHCQDIGSEIRFAFQHLAEQKIPAEKAVIVCPDEGYGMRAAEEGKILGFGVDSAFGVPAEMTGTSQTIRCLLDWADRNYDAEALLSAAVNGSIGLYDGEGRLAMVGQEMMNIFRRQQVGWGRERWAALARSEEERPAMAGELMNRWADFFEAPERPVREVAAELTELLRRCMIRGDENELYLSVIDELSRIYTGRMKGRDYLALAEEAASGQKVGAQMTEKPGRVFCCGYENALYLNREYFIMLGMNWDAFNKLGREFPLLHDDRKRALSPGLRLREDNARERRYTVKEFLINRPEARVIFCRAGLDYAGGEELIPAGIFEDAAEKYLYTDPATGEKEDRTPRITILDRNPMTRLDVYLKKGYDPGTREAAPDEGREELWKKDFESRWYTATRLETACACPRKYALTVQMRIDSEKPEALEQFGQVWLGGAGRGSLVHEVLDRYFTTIAPRREETDTGLLDTLLEEQLEIFRRNVPVPVNLKDLTPEIEAIRKILYEAADMHARDRGRETVGTEISFGETQSVILSFGDYRIRLSGRIDRVDRVGGAYEIIDYKTGSPIRFRREMGNKLQYYLYTLAWESLHPDQKISRASYDLLDGTGGIDRITVEMDEKTRGEMYQKMIGILDMISDPRRAFTPGFELDEDRKMLRYDSCPDYCAFKPLCREVFR